MSEPSRPISTDERPCLHLPNAADFEIDRDGDLCIEFETDCRARRTWLTRPEAEQLKEWLNEVLT